MREIKFRAWDKENKEMVFNSFDTLCEVMINIDGSLWMPDKYYRGGEESYILMQYTGLKDKNGKEGYWGDIVSDGINPPFVITPDYHLLARLSEIEFEIISNIYETNNEPTSKLAGAK